MPEIQYPNNSNSDTAFVVQEGGQKNRVLMTVQDNDGTVEYSDSPNSTNAYVTIDGKKHRAMLTAPQDTSTLEMSNNPNSTKGYVTVDGKKHRVVLTANIAGGGGSAPVINELNVTPSTSAQTITAPTGVDGYSPVNVSAVTSAIDANITAGNIKKDVQILGVTGSYEGQTPTGTKSITANGTHNVADYEYADVQVPTTAPALYREFQLDSTGKLVPNTTTTHIMNFTGMTDVSDYALARAYFGNAAISGAVDMSDLTTVSSINACYYMFSGCTGITSIDLSSLTTLSGNNACGSMFYGCTGLTSVDLSSLTTLSGSSACNSMFYGCTGITSIDLSSLTTLSGNSACQNMFPGCTGITSIDLSSLTTLSGNYACSSMFSGCAGLTSVDLSGLTTVSGNNACSSMFSGCSSLATVYIGGTIAIDFGGRTNVFNAMFTNCSQNIDVYAPAANQSAIEAFSGYPKFGGTGTVTWHWRS